VDGDRNYSRSVHGIDPGEGITEKLEGQNRSLAAWTARLVLAGGTRSYLQAWSRAMTGTPLDSDDARAVHRMQAVQRALSVAGGSGTGGYGIPTMLDPTLILTAALQTSPIRRLARQENLTFENQWRGLASGGIVASWDTEASEVSDDSPTFTQPTVDTVMARAFVPFSIEISEDFPNLLSDLAVMFAEAKQVLEDVAFVSGNGSTAPMGIVTTIAATTAMRVSATTGGSFGQPDLYKLQNALPVRFRMMGNAAYVVNNATINLIRQFPTAVGVQGYLSEVGNGQPTRLLGSEMIESSVITSTVTTGNTIAVFGDFSRYLIVNKVGVQTELIPHLFHTANNLPSGQRGMFMRWRVGGKVIDTNAFVGLTL
jgi:HK97 family phage major capsid protein